MLGAVAVASGGGGTVLAVYAVRHARAEANDECEQALRAERHAHEVDARALHGWRMRHPGEPEPEP